MEDNFKGILIGLVLFSVFAFLMTYTAVEMGKNYGVNSAEIGNGALNDDEFKNSVDDVATKSENYRQRFESGDVDNVDDPSGLFTIVTDMISLITTPFTLLGSVMTNILDIPTMVISVVLGILGISLILGIWRLLRIGD